ncbi:hypothetical protein B484DRAFT_444472, partial [Ochromonadaceae sp. CCMP2298]
MSQLQDSQQPEGEYTFVKSPPPDLTCSICRGLLQDPVLVCTQQHVFCSGCIKNWKAKSNDCPECRERLSNRNQYPARLAKNMILLLEVRCPHAGRNGGGNSGGAGSVPANSSSSSSDITTDTEDGHQHKRGRQNNDTKPSSMPARSCEWTGPLQDCEAHAAACPFEEVSCPFKEVGCVYRAARGDMGAHSGNMAAHSLMLMTAFAAVKAESASFQVKIPALELECAALKGKVASLEKDSSSLQRYVSTLNTSEEEAAVGGMEWVSSRTVNAGTKDEEFKYTGQIPCHGFGRASWVDGDCYDGQWKEGQHGGQGIFKWSNGDCYEGQWEEGVGHGQGTMEWIDGRSYKGLWKEDSMHGQGVFKCINGDIYEGKWKDDKKQGQFIITKKATGTRY